MQSAEEQKQAPTVPTIAPQTDSMPIKKQHGGKRPGAGRKPDPTKILLKGVSKEALALAVENIDVWAIVRGLLHSKREVIRIQALNFVFDRMLGKPKQEIGVSGGFVHAHVRDPRLAGMPKEALEALALAYDGIVAKYGAPALPESSQIQPESNQEETAPVEAIPDE